MAEIIENVFPPVKGGDRYGKQWTKVVTGLDRSKKGGFMYEGDFVSLDRSGDFPAGTLFLAFGHTGSRRRPTPGAGLYRLDPYTDDAGQKRNYRRVDIAEHGNWAMALREATEKALASKQETIASSSTPRENKIETTLPKERFTTPKKGSSVPVSDAKAHFREHAASRSSDLDKTAKRVAPAKAETEEDRQLQRLWFKNPSDLDFEGVDTKGSMGRTRKRSTIRSRGLR